MSDTATIVIIVVVVLLLVTIAAVLMRKRAQERRAHEAGQLREVAATHTHEVTEADREARRREAEAEIARAEAERAETEAARARQGAAQTEATREHLVREADRIDPSVDTRNADYAPTDPAISRDDVAGDPPTRT